MRGAVALGLLALLVLVAAPSAQASLVYVAVCASQCIESHVIVGPTSSEVLLCTPSTRCDTTPVAAGAPLPNFESLKCSFVRPIVATVYFCHDL